MPPVIAEEMLSPDEVADLLGVSTGTLANWRSHRKGPRFLKCPRVRYERAAVAAYLEERRRAAAVWMAS